jgi:hypothetical protein
LHSETATKLLDLLPRKATALHEHYHTRREARLNFTNWYLYAAHDGQIDPTLFLFRNQVCFHVSGYVNAQNKSYWYEENPTLIREVLLRDMYCLGMGYCEHASGPFFSTKVGGIFYI